MELTSILAIYMLFWVLSAFLILPFGIRNSFETGEELVRGQDEGAPTNFRPQRILLHTTILATLLFALFYANYVNGWITVDNIDVFGAQERL